MNAFELHASRQGQPQVQRPAIKTDGKQIERVLEGVKYSPATSRDISRYTGLSVKAASAYLCRLREAGLVEVTGTVRTNHKAKASNVYELRNQ
jgi:predicted Rossmann fold nucleotide-binding protein DprA/Smf involved in DNA uptake